MCMLTVFPMPGLWSDKMEERLLNGVELNPHGHGWAVIVNGSIIVGKSLDGDEAVAAFMDLYQRATGPALFHSRWATHGAKDLDNVHPFPAGGGIGRTFIAHNGIMPKESIPTLDDPRSDTRVFADDILPRKFSRLDSPKVREYLERWLGGNKIAVLTTNRRYQRQVYLLNAELGEWVDGVWFSNADYEGYGAYLKKYGLTQYGDDDSYSYSYISELNATHYELQDESEEPCVWCHQRKINGFAICEVCGTCQDCWEPGATCQCYTPADERVPVSSEAREEWGGWVS